MRFSSPTRIHIFQNYGKARRGGKGKRVRERQVISHLRILNPPLALPASSKTSIGKMTSFNHSLRNFRVLSALIKTLHSRENYSAVGQQYVPAAKDRAVNVIISTLLLIFDECRNMYKIMATKQASSNMRPIVIMA
jgi:hypothetical protein